MQGSGAFLFRGKKEKEENVGRSFPTQDQEMKPFSVAARTAASVLLAYQTFKLLETARKQSGDAGVVDVVDVDVDKRQELERTRMRGEPQVRGGCDDAVECEAEERVNQRGDEGVEVDQDPRGALASPLHSPECGGRGLLDEDQEDKENMTATNVPQPKMAGVTVTVTSSEVCPPCGRGHNDTLWPTSNAVSEQLAWQRRLSKAMLRRWVLLVAATSASNLTDDVWWQAVTAAVCMVAATRPVPSHAGPRNCEGSEEERVAPSGNLANVADLLEDLAEGAFEAFDRRLVKRARRASAAAALRVLVAVHELCAQVLVAHEDDLANLSHRGRLLMRTLRTARLSSRTHATRSRRVARMSLP